MELLHWLLFDLFTDGGDPTWEETPDQRAGIDPAG